MSPAPHAPCGGQHCPVVAMLLAPRSNPLPIPEKINGPPPVGLPLRQKAKGGAAALEGRLAGVEWGVLAALAA